MDAVLQHRPQLPRRLQRLAALQLPLQLLTSELRSDDPTRGVQLVFAGVSRG